MKLELVRPVPKCMFDEATFEEFREYSNLDKTCNVSSYVLPDGSVQFCTIMDDIRRAPAQSADELRETILEFQAEDGRLRRQPSFGACKSCGHSCQGGCLSYKKYGDGL